jgi:hypothetical protein
MRRNDFPVDAIILERAFTVGPPPMDRESLMERVRMFNHVCECDAEVLVIACSRLRTLREVFVRDFEAIEFRAVDRKWISPWAEVPADHVYFVSRGRSSPLL